MRNRPIASLSPPRAAWRRGLACVLLLAWAGAARAAANPPNPAPQAASADAGAPKTASPKGAVPKAAAPAAGQTHARVAPAPGAAKPAPPAPLAPPHTGPQSGPKAAPPPPAHRATPRIMTASRAKSGRIIIVVPRGITPLLTQSSPSGGGGGENLDIALPQTGAVKMPAKLPRNVTGMTGEADHLAVHLAPGVHARVSVSATRMVIDLPDPPAPPLARPAEAAAPLDFTLVPDLPPGQVKRMAAGLTPAPSAAQGGAPGRATGPEGAGRAAPEAVGRTPPEAPAPPQELAPPAETNFAPPAGALAASRVPGSTEPAMMVPFGRAVGAAAFKRGRQAIAVFDEARPIDLGPLHDDPDFGSAAVHMLPNATMLTMSLPAGRRLGLRKRPDGWVLSLTTKPPEAPSGRLQLANGVLHIPVVPAGASLAITDPGTGGALLIGTLSDTGTGLPAGHAGPEYVLLPSLAGVVVEARSDRLILSRGRAGFSLAMQQGPPLATTAASPSEADMAASGALSRRFDLVAAPVPELRQRLIAAVALAAVTPRLARLVPRQQAASAMLTLGLYREAEGALNAALADNAGQLPVTELRALQALAHILDGARRDEDGVAADALALQAPALGESDEVHFWRALAAPADAPQAERAAILAQTWRLLLAYPPPLRHRLAPQIGAVMLQNGQAEAAAALAEAIDDPALDMLRAQLLLRGGKTAAALALLDRIGVAHDRRQSAMARRSAIEIRLSQHTLTPADAADGLERLLYAWQDDESEPGLRQQIAVLAAESGAWRRAFSGLRRAEALFPDRHEAFHDTEVQLMQRLLQAGKVQHIQPIELVALAEENADLLGSGAAAAVLAPVLADKLAALDLPERAAPVLGRMMDATDSPQARAAIGLRLAEMRLEQGEANEAGTVLAATDAPGLPAPLAEARRVLRARALEAAGQGSAALSEVESLTSPAALTLQAHLKEARQDWAGAASALRALLQATAPPDGPLTEVQQDLVLRLASDAARAGDIAELHRLQEEEGKRLTAGSRASLLQALTQAPVETVGDLPRAGREAAAEQGLPAALAAYKAH